MNWFNDLRIGVKLAIGFAGITLLSMALGAFTFSRTATSITEFDRIQNDWVPGTQAMAEIRAQLGEFRTYELAQIARADDPKAVEDYFNRKRKLRDDVAATQGVIEKSLIDPKEKEMYAQAKDSLAKYLAASSELDEAIRQHDVAAAQTISDDKSRPLRRDLFKQLVALTDHARAGCGAGRCDRLVYLARHHPPARGGRGPLARRRPGQPGDPGRAALAR